MASTSCNERAALLLGYCLRGERWPPALVRELADDCSDSLFRVVAEGLADRFEPALCDTYAELFAEAIAPGESETLVERYRRVRIPRLITGDPRTVFVLSRVTLGADVAVTSVILDAAKRRFPEAAICLVAPRKNWELFAADPRILHVPVSYRRGTLSERLASGPELRAALAQPDSIVIDPDSRLTQLGLLPVCPEERYYFFESRGYGGDGDDPLPLLAGTGRSRLSASRTRDRLWPLDWRPARRASPSAWAWARIRPSESPIHSKRNCWRCWRKAACR